MWLADISARSSCWLQLGMKIINPPGKLNVAAVLLGLLSVLAPVSPSGSGGSSHGQTAAPATVPQDPAPDQTTREDGEGDVVRVETNLITVSATVMDRSGRYVPDLRPEDFRIFEDGVEQEVAFFAPVEQPFTILFLLDTSGTMEGRIGELVAAANAFLDHLRPDDRVFAASFDDVIRILHEATAVTDLRGRDAFNKLKSRGSRTMLFGAVDQALKRVKDLPGRKAVVLFSDGYNNGPLEMEFRATDFGAIKRTMREAEELDALIYTVQYRLVFGANKTDAKRRYNTATEYMQGLAEKTGGRHYQVEDIADLRKTFGMVAEELRRQYSLGYYPKRQLRAGERRQIRVKVGLPGPVVRARGNYAAGPSKQPRRH
jgi:VWFA-related protein